MLRGTQRLAAALAVLPCLALGFGLAPTHGGLAFRGSAALASRPRSALGAPAGPVTHTRTHTRPLGIAMQSTKTAGQRAIIAVIAFGFLFGAIYPLANNSLRFAAADKSMSGAATKMRQSEIDERLRTVPVFVVTDTKNSPYVAETQEGMKKGFFFLDPTDAEAYQTKIRELQGPDAAVKITPTTLDKAIGYIKTKKSEDPFEVFPSAPEVTKARAIQNPDTCDICWGSEGVKEYVPVFWVKGLGLEVDKTVVTPLFFEKDMAVGYYSKLGKNEPPEIEVFDLSALIKKIRKGGSTEFRKVSFYPSTRAVQYANKVVSAPAAEKAPAEGKPAQDVIEAQKETMKTPQLADEIPTLP